MDNTLLNMEINNDSINPIYSLKIYTKIFRSHTKNDSKKCHSFII